jgi:hypothetical protein
MAEKHTLDASSLDPYIRTRYYEDERYQIGNTDKGPGKGRGAEHHAEGFRSPTPG